MLRYKIAEIRKSCPHCKSLDWMEILGMECGVVTPDKEIHFSAVVSPHEFKWRRKGLKEALKDFTESEYGL